MIDFLFARANVLAAIAIVLDSIRRWLSTQLASRWAFAPFASDHNINALWLTNVLRARKLIDAREFVASSNMETFAHRGLGGDCRRVVVNVDGADAPKTLSLILKRSDISHNGRVRNIFGGAWREGTVYAEREFRALYGELIEEPLFARGSALLGEFVVLQRDFNAMGGTALNKLIGDQIFGAKLVGEQATAAAARLHSLFVRIADVHAKNWRRTELSERFPWLRGAAWRARREQATWERSLETTRRLWRDARAYHSKGPVVLRPRLVALIERSLAASSFERFVADAEKESFTLAHGDFHAQNMFVMSDKSFRLVDWSECSIGNGPTEIGQCIVSDLQHALFRAHALRLLRAYWERLVECGVVDFDFETCRAEFVGGTIRRWIFFVCLLAGFGPVLPSVLTQYFHDQLEQFILEFGDIDATYPLGLVGVLI